MNRVKLFASLAVLFLVVVSCSKLQNLAGGDRLYFCEKYTTKVPGGAKIGNSPCYEPSEKGHELQPQRFR